MFTGLVEELGTVERVDDLGDAMRLTVRAAVVLDGTSPGDSIAVDGCCLTVTSIASDAAPGASGASSASRGGTWTADVMRETLERTSLRGVAPGMPVNLERAATLQTRLGGHLVQGHVDGVGTVARRTPAEHWEVVEIAVPPDLTRYLVTKGSVTVDGVSLTVVSATDDSFTVSLIPETLARTTLGQRLAGETVNIEVDVIAKYVERMLEAHR